MTDITFYRDKADRIRRVAAHGHTGYAEAGSDIVCAAVSALLLNAANGLSDVVGADISCQVQDGLVSFVLPGELPECEAYGAQVLLDSLFLSITSLAQQYNEYITLHESEV